MPNTSNDAESQDQDESKRSPNKQLLDMMALFSQVTLNISTEQAYERRVKKRDTRAVIFFLNRCLSLTQVQEWFDGELKRNRRLSITTVTSIRSKNFHVKFVEKPDKDKALTTTHLKYLRQ